MTEVVHDPYESVNWGTVKQCLSAWHFHPSKGSDTAPHETIDIFGEELDYKVFAVGDESFDPMRWPWTELTDAPGAEEDWEDRNPEDVGEEGVISFPAQEWNDTGEHHVGSLFSTIWNGEVDVDDLNSRHDLIEATLEKTEYHEPDGSAAAFLCHTRRYYQDPHHIWERYIDDFEKWSRDDGLLGLEIINKVDSALNEHQHERPFGHDISLWDYLLTYFAPDRMIWGISVSDSGGWNGGPGVDRGIRPTTLLIDESDFDPSDQEGSRDAVVNAYYDGALFAHWRQPWDHDTEDPTDHPTVTDIDIDDNEITLTASDYDEIRWMSRGYKVGSGTTIELEPSHSPYVRAELVSDQAETYTQPWGIEADNHHEIGDATLGVGGL